MPDVTFRCIRAKCAGGSRWISIETTERAIRRFIGKLGGPAGLWGAREDGSSGREEARVVLPRGIVAVRASADGTAVSSDAS